MFANLSSLQVHTYLAERHLSLCQSLLSRQTKCMISHASVAGKYGLPQGMAVVQGRGGPVISPCVSLLYATGQRMLLSATATLLSSFVSLRVPGLPDDLAQRLNRTSDAHLGALKALACRSKKFCSSESDAVQRAEAASAAPATRRSPAARSACLPW